MLAEKPAWPKQPRDFKAFRKAADAYVADHFPIRPHLIGLLNLVRMDAGVSGSSRVIVGRDGWLFYDDDSHLGAARNDPPMPAAQTRAWLATLAGRTEAVRAEGAAYLVVSPPVKEVIYPDEAPAWFGRPAPDRSAVTLPRLARTTGAGEVLYLGPQIATATRSGQKTYSRHDTHWTGYGAYAGYVGLMGKLKAMGVTQEEPWPQSKFQKIELTGVLRPRDLALMLGVSSFVKLDYPHLRDPAAERKIHTTYLAARKDWTAPQVVDTGEIGKPVLLMTRDSFSNEMLPFLYPHFSRIILTHIQDGFWRPDMMARYRPDVVVLEILEPGLGFAVGDGPRPSPEAAARINAAVSGEPASAPADAAATRTGSSMTPDGKLLALLNKATPAAGCNLEAAALTVDKGGKARLKLSGWISELGPSITAPLGVVRLRGPSGDVVGEIRVDLPRADVAAFFKKSTGGKSGFIAALDAGNLAKGVYRPVVYRRSVDGWIACEGPQTLTVP